jgi:hypothetical protein
MMVISMLLPLINNGPWPTLATPEQLMKVGVIDGVWVGSGVLDGGSVCVGGGASVAGPATRVMLDGNLVKVDTGRVVGVFVTKDWVGILDGVLVSAEKAIGTEEPKMGIDMMNVRALEETMSSGSIGMIETIGS